MRLSSLLVVAVATFLASCDAVTTATHSEQKISALASINAAPAKSLRFLRSARTEGEDEDSEERAVKVPSYLTHPLLAPEKQVVAAAKAAEKATKLAKADNDILTALQKIDNGLSRFMRWKMQEFTPTTVKQILTKAKVRPDSPEWQTYKWYLAAFLRQYHKVN